MNVSNMSGNRFIEPLADCITIASACMKLYRAKFMQRNTIAIIPEKGYRARDVSSVKAMKWID